MAAEQDHYEVLGVSPKSEPEVIKAAYRAMMRKYHPDAAAGTASKLRAQAINDAYAVLSDPLKRSAYDRTRDQGPPSPPPPPPEPAARPTQQPMSKGLPPEYDDNAGLQVLLITLGLGAFLLVLGAFDFEVAEPNSPPVETQTRIAPQAVTIVREMPLRHGMKTCSLSDGRVFEMAATLDCLAVARGEMPDNSSGASGGDR